jgi:hypothetical protein
VGERSAVAELALVPDLIDVVEVLADRLRRPAGTPGPPDELDAGVDALNVIVIMGTGDRGGADVVIFKLGGCLPAAGQVEALNKTSRARGYRRPSEMACSLIPNGSS